MKWQKYNYINSLELLRDVDEFLMDGETPKYRYMAFDTETNGLDIYKASVIGFSFSVDSKSGFYVPLVEWIPDITSKKIRTVNKQKYESFERGHLKCVWTGNIYEEFFKPHEYNMPEFIPAILSRWFKPVNLIMHNAPFDVNHVWTISGVDLSDSLFLDTALLSHILNENSLNGLKETAVEWKDELGINPYIAANQEQKELGGSVIRNGGHVTKGGKAKTIWRAEPQYLGKYACADTFLTYGLFEVGLQKFISKFGEEKLDWLFNDEVMPVCKEVVIPMKRNGVFIDVEHFKTIELETRQKLLDLEDEFNQIINPYLDSFDVGKSFDEVVTHNKLIKKIIELENLKIPTKLDKKTGEEKETLAKGMIKKVYQENPHWLWGYILGEDELKYSNKELMDIKQKIFEENENRRHRFNINSGHHLKWLFFEKLGFNKTEFPQTESATKDNPIPSLEADVIKELILPTCPWVKVLLTYKKLKKIHSTYILPAINLNLDGWLYMDMKQSGTVSGRFACSGGFNLQTLPRIDNEMEDLESCKACLSEEVAIIQEIQALADLKCTKCGHIEKDIIRSSVIKRGFIAPPGYKIVNADYSSLEPRCFAYQSGDNKLKEVYWKGLDLYSKVYCDVFDKEKKYSAHPDDENFLKTVNKSARTGVKPIVLGIPYGANAYQVAQLTGKKKIIIDNETGKEVEIPDYAYGQFVIDAYLNTYTELKKYMEKQETDAWQKGYVETIIGRRRHFMYAPKISKFLLLKGLKPKDLVNASPSKIKKGNVNFVSEYGNNASFTIEELKSLVYDLGLPWQNCQTKGYWSYIRNLLKADLNNAKNFPIQGVAGHITNRGMLDTTRLFKENNIVGYIALQVHDEIMAYAKTEQSEKASECLKIGMEDNFFAKKIDIPMIAQPTICDNVMEAK